MKDHLEHMARVRPGIDGEATRWAIAEIERLQDRCDDLAEALQRIEQWASAYPTDIFHEPTTEECRKAHEVLKANGMTLDAFSASMGRHCLKGVGDIARGALSSPDRVTP